MLTEAELSLLDRYLIDDLSPTELSEFKERLNSDFDFRTEIEAQIQLISLLRNNENDLIRSLVKESVPLLSTKQPKRRSWYQYVAAACILIIFILVANFYYEETAANKAQMFIAEYFEVFPLKSPTRSKEDTFSKAFQLYEDHYYQEALIYLIEYGDQQDPNNKYNLAIGSAYLKLNKWENAANWFEPSLSSSDRIIKNHANWYYALCLLMKKDEQGEILLNQISKSKGPYQDLAKKLLRELD